MNIFLLCVIIAYALGIGFLLGASACMYSVKHPSEKLEVLDEKMPPAMRLVVLIASPIFAIVWMIFEFFHGTED